jgi:hypothetical protein
MLRNKSMILDINILFLDFNCMLYITLFLMKKQELCHYQKPGPKNAMPDNDVKN